MRLLLLLQNKLRQTELVRQTLWHPLLFAAIGFHVLLLGRSILKTEPAEARIPPEFLGEGDDAPPKWDWERLPRKLQFWVLSPRKDADSG